MSNADPYESELLASIEAGEMPLDVFADWLEERGDTRAVGARWLAKHEKRPIGRGRALVWYRGRGKESEASFSLPTMAFGLLGRGAEIKHGVMAYSTFRVALEDAIEAVARLEGG